MDYTVEQKSELEALESIYYGDFQLLNNDKSKFSIPIKTDSETEPSCDLVITYTAKYPDEPPIIEVDNTVNFDECYGHQLLVHLQETAKNNMGMVMVFTLVSSAQEWLHDKYESGKAAKQQKQAQELRELDEAERKRFEGTRVSVETFFKWKQLFERELGIDKQEAEKEGPKLTGRELFMIDNTLNESDLKFLYDRIKVDESLFQDLDDLELEDEDDDPNNIRESF